MKVSKSAQEEQDTETKTTTKLYKVITKPYERAIGYYIEVDNRLFYCDDTLRQVHNSIAHIDSEGRMVLDFLGENGAFGYARRHNHLREISWLELLLATGWSKPQVLREIGVGGAGRVLDEGGDL